MTWSATVHTTLSSDTEPSIIVTFSDAKYIFNASENSVRGFQQTNGNWRKARAMFFTQANIEKTSGLTAMIMTFADTTIGKLALHGPPGLTHILASSRYYTFRDSIDVQPKEIPWTTHAESISWPCFTDANVTVYAIPVLPLSEPVDVNPGSETPAISASNLSSLPAECISPLALPEKRKQDPSQDSPRKRFNPGSLAPGRMILSDELLAEVRKQDFSPAALSGSLADEFRRMVIKAMFPNTALHPALDDEKKKEQKQKSKAGAKAKALGLTPTAPPENPTIDFDVDTHRRGRGSLPNGFHKQLPKFLSDLPTSSNPTISYLVVGPRYRGKFNVEKARELGVVGPDRGRLTRGETITIEVKVGEEIIERVVKPDDVLGESETPSALLILDVPSVGHIGPLVSAIKNSELYRKMWIASGTSASTSDFHLRAIYHICGDKVLEDEAYKAFLNAFSPDVHHIIASKEHCPDPVTFTNAAHNQLQLNILDQRMFPLPKFSVTSKKNLRSISNLPPNIQPMSSGLNVIIRPFSPPAIDPEIASLDKFHPLATGVETLELSTKIERRLNAAKANVQKKLHSDGLLPTTAGSQVGIIPLGTAGSMPNKYRNVLSTLVRIPEWGNILLDVGEGTWGQLARNFGLEEDGEYNTWQALRDLKCIFISHIHGDHHIGLAHLLAKRKLLDPPPDHPLYLVSIRTVHLYIRELSDIQDLGLFDPSGNGVLPVLSETLHFRATGAYPTTGMWRIGGNEPWLDFGTSVENGKKMCEELGLKYFITTDVHHRCRCFGCSFEHQEGWKITFSGDTMPTDNLVKIGKNSTVLIHEATMPDDEPHLARTKAHSTIGQAIGIGQKMNAKNILLTHFSGRIPKLPPSVSQQMVEDGPGAKHLVVPAFDHANMTIGDMWKMPFYIPVLMSNMVEGQEESKSRSASPVEDLVPKMEENRKVAMAG